jgi:DNA-binding MarR family transcriptional regulator
MSEPGDHVERLLEQWRRERPDLDVAPLGVVGRLFRVTQLADRVLGEGLAANGLQPGWFDVLAALRRAGSPHELSPGRLIRALMLSSAGMTKRLDRMAESDLVERRPDPEDRRGVLVRLTPRGRELVDEVLGPHVEREKRLLEALSPTEQRTLDALLRKLLVELEPDS